MFFPLDNKRPEMYTNPFSRLSIIQCELENMWISWLSYLGSWFWSFDFYPLEKTVIPICRLPNSFTPLSSGIRDMHCHISSGSWNGILLNSYISDSYLQIHMETLYLYYRLVFLTVLWSDPTKYLSLSSYFGWSLTRLPVHFKLLFIVSELFITSNYEEVFVIYDGKVAQHWKMQI